MVKRSGMMAFAACALAAVAGYASAEPITDEQLKEKLDAYQAKYAEMRQAGGMTREMLENLSKETMQGVDVSSLTFDQLKQVQQRNLLRFAGLESEGAQRAAEFAKEPTAEGASASVLRIMMLMNKAYEQDDFTEVSAAVGQTLKHPGLGELLTTSDAGLVMRGLGSLPQEARDEHLTALCALAASLPANMDKSGVLGIRSLASSLAGAADKLDRDAYEQARTHMAAIVAAAASASQDEREKKYLDDAVAFLNSAYARGELLNHEAPDFEILWSSDESITSLKDLRGKVVVVDFWATWCGPCRASFPNVRELVKRYEGYPVAVIGMTSPQGRHYPGDKGGEPVDCTNDEAKEFGLMPGFMKDHEMTWPVMFSRQNVFNPDFGVSGIPHVAIIDPAGKVRYNGLHPGGSLKEKAEKIDALLAEAGLQTPGPVDTPAAGEEKTGG